MASNSSQKRHSIVSRAYGAEILNYTENPELANQASLDLHISSSQSIAYDILPCRLMASKFRSTSWCNNDCLGEKPGLQEFVTVQVILKYALAQKATKWVHTGIGSVKSHCTQTLEAHVTCFVSILGKNIHAVTVTHLQTACTLLYHEHVSWHSQVAQIFFPVNAMVYEFVQARVLFFFLASIMHDTSLGRKWNYDLLGIRGTSEKCS